MPIVIRDRQVSDSLRYRLIGVRYELEQSLREAKEKALPGLLVTDLEGALISAEGAISRLEQAQAA